MRDYKILALDGGGSWALIQIKTLMNLYGDLPGHEVLKKFDMVCANSGGALSLAGLVMNWKLSETLKVFEEQAERDKVFVRTTFFEAPIKHIARLFDIGPKYKTEAKYAGLQAKLGEVGAKGVSELPAYVGARPDGWPVRFLICGFDYDRQRAVFFRSDKDSLAGSRSTPPKPGEQAPKEATLTQAVHASSNAPVNYFDKPAAGPSPMRYWDGGVGGYNNPVLAGVIEAVANATRYGTDRSRIRAMSIGTGNVVLPMPRGNDDADMVTKLETSSLTTDIAKLAKSILGDPPDAATFHAYLMLGCPLPGPNDPLPMNDRIVRLNPLIQPLPDGNGKWKFPDGMDRESFKFIRDLDMDATKQPEVMAVDAFCELWFKDSIPNQPIRAGGPELKPEIGYGRYSAAKSAALQMFP